MFNLLHEANVYDDFSTLLRNTQAFSFTLVGDLNAIQCAHRSFPSLQNIGAQMNREVMAELKTQL